MADESTRPIKIFYSYSRADKKFRVELERHLEPLRRSGQISGWHDHEIPPGTEWRHEVNKHLAASDIILLLVSHNFMSSEYCYSEELQRALEMHKTGKTRVIPIILSPVNWKRTPIGGLQVLPRDGKPITEWRSRNKAFQEIVEGIEQVIRGLLDGIDRAISELIEEFNKQYFQMGRSDEEWIDTTFGRMYSQYKGRYSDIFSKIEEIIEDDPAIWWADVMGLMIMFYCECVVSFFCLKHMKRAFRLILGHRWQIDGSGRFFPENAHWKYQNIHANIAYRRTVRVLQQDPTNTKAYYIQSIALIGLGKYQEALVAANLAHSFDPHFPGIYDLRCTVLALLERIGDALDDLEQAKRLNPDDAEDYNRVKALFESLRKPIRWIQQALPSRGEFLAIPEVAESLHFGQIKENTEPPCKDTE